MNYAEAAALRRLAAHQSRRSGSGRAARPRSTMLTPSELPRPPPKDLPNPVVYDKIARPRAYYQRPVTKKDLPIISSRWPALAAFGLAGIAAWGAFILYATNQERLSSSVVRQILVNLRESEAVVDALGEGIRPEPAWYLNGDPWISGSINMMQGSVDVSFRVKGSKAAGTLYFTSIRRSKGTQFSILRFKIIRDDGRELNIPIPDQSK